MRSALASQHYLSPPLSTGPIVSYRPGTKYEVQYPYESLTDRQREVLHLAARGHTNTEIARRLKISKRTVEAHRAGLMKRLGIKSYAGLIRYAIQRRASLMTPRSEVVSFV